MDNEVKLGKFKNAIKHCLPEQLLQLREDCLEKLSPIPAYRARQTYMYKALCAVEDEMCKRGED